MQVKNEMSDFAVSSDNKFNKNRKVFSMKNSIDKAWDKISPVWPMKNMIAVNPLQGLENMKFDAALKDALKYFQMQKAPLQMEAVNRETIKWCQAYFDQGQARIAMPFREKGLFQSWLLLAKHDKNLYGKNKSTRLWLSRLSTDPMDVISQCMYQLKIPNDKYTQFFSLMLTTLAGWCGYIKYRTSWCDDVIENQHPVTAEEFLAMRLVITTCLWPKAAEFLNWDAEHDYDLFAARMKQIHESETSYQDHIVAEIARNSHHALRPSKKSAFAQFVFCIDVRSEQFRRSLESIGHYETYGFAGFFGMSLEIHHQHTQKSFSSCPVLLKPTHKVSGCLNDAVCDSHSIQKRIDFVKSMKGTYESLKYTFSIPFTLVEIMGPFSGAWMGLKTFFPSAMVSLQRQFTKKSLIKTNTVPNLQESAVGFGIPLEQQCTLAEAILNMIGITKDFSPYVVICGHGSETENNAYATALDCGACGGHQGDMNAKVLVSMLNQPEVRSYLKTKGIVIPAKTQFIAAEHNTTTDDVALFTEEECEDLRRDLAVAKKISNKIRYQQLSTDILPDNIADLTRHIKNRSTSWSQTRPEWGLASNAAFIVGPRSLTEKINLEGRSFLHSYDWKADEDSKVLTTILTAPMVVAQWINGQYLFSTLDNVAFGGGSKITQNVAGKIGVMQGNASDLMHGLALQSVYRNDTTPYHEAVRLLTIVMAPRSKIDNIIANQEVLQKLFGNEWVRLISIDPLDNAMYKLQPDLTWKHIKQLPEMN